MRRALLVAGVVALGLAAVALNPNPVLAATYSTTCPASDDACAALAERIEANTAATEALGPKLDTLHTDLTTSSTTTVDGTVALSSDDADRLDLSAWGIWFLGGVCLCLLFSNLWHRAWAFWR